MENVLDTVPHTIVVTSDGAELLLNHAGEALWLRESSYALTPLRAPASTKIPGIRHKIALWQSGRPPTVSTESAWRVREVMKDWGLPEREVFGKDGQWSEFDSIVRHLCHLPHV